MKLKHFAACAVIALWSPAALANYFALGVGPDTCGRLLIAADRDSRLGSRPSPTAVGDGEFATELSWIDGFVTAVNVMQKSTAGAHATGKISWIVNYCRENPNDRLADVAIEYFKHLSSNGG